MAIKAADDVVTDLKALPEFVTAETYINTKIIPRFVAEKSNMITVKDTDNHPVALRRQIIFLLTKAGYTVQWDRDSYNVSV